MRKLFTRMFGGTTHCIYIACLLSVSACSSFQQKAVIMASGGSATASGAFSSSPVSQESGSGITTPIPPPPTKDISEQLAGTVGNLNRLVGLSSVDVRPLLPGLSEDKGYAAYTYLIITADEGAQATAAICGFARSRMSSTGDSNKDDPRTTALYYIPQKTGAYRSMPLQLKVAIQSYDEARAASLAARLNLAPSIYLITYIGEPLPTRPKPDDNRLDVVEIGGLSPRRVYQYVRAYRDQLSPGGEYWRTRTLRQIGIVVAEQLSLVNHIKEMAGYLITTAQAAERPPSGRDLPSTDERVPRVCLDDLVAMR